MPEAKASRVAKAPRTAPAPGAQKPKSKARTELEDKVALWLDAMVLQGDCPSYVRQYVWLGRKSWDFCWPEKLLAIEIEGGTWNRGKHGRGSGIERDIQKINLAQLHGWTVYRMTSPMIRARSPAVVLLGRMFGKVSIPLR